MFYRRRQTYKRVSLLLFTIQVDSRDGLVNRLYFYLISLFEFWNQRDETRIVVKIFEPRVYCQKTKTVILYFK